MMGVVSGSKPKGAIVVLMIINWKKGRSGGMAGIRAEGCDCGGPGRNRYIESFKAAWVPIFVVIGIRELLWLGRIFLEKLFILCTDCGIEN